MHHFLPSTVTDLPLNTGTLQTPICQGCLTNLLQQFFFCQQYITSTFVAQMISLSLLTDYISTVL